MDLDALVDLSKEISNFSVTHLPGVHAKVYLADKKLAIITSGNLTHSGLRGNIEYGVALRNKVLVRQVRDDIEGFATLGTGITNDKVEALSSEMKHLKVLFTATQKSIRWEAKQLFEDRVEAAQIDLIRLKISGRSPNSLFAETLKFLLRNGPLQTCEIHPRVQAIHPDLCDDSVDRVIDGINFGKKWKHQVRTAQQHLKRNGDIQFDGKYWTISEEKSLTRRRGQ